jgi:hypothetical protein
VQFYRSLIGISMRGWRSVGLGSKILVRRGRSEELLTATVAEREPAKAIESPAGSAESTGKDAEVASVFP